ncbi:hypothetical protein [Pseudoxanthomonas sp. 10H]|uniref:hypothetical protein n=1 Tax=Pseudoxanthomonas sp. 10H TaxID=3242729 RepID=UPI0035570770
MTRSILPLWILPLAIALVMLVAAHLAWWLSLRAGYIEPCNPYWDGCTSISRAARHGLGNHLFRLLMLPCAVLVAAHWWLASRWVASAGPRSRLLAGLGLASAAALGVYATFLGTEGAAYGFLRRYGITVFFGCGFLAQLVFLRRWLRDGRCGASRRQWRAMVAVCAAMLLLGAGNVAGDALLHDRVRQDRLENALEWQLGLLLAGWYLLQAWQWRRERLLVSFAGPR